MKQGQDQGEKEMIASHWKSVKTILSASVRKYFVLSISISFKFSFSGKKKSFANC